MVAFGVLAFSLCGATASTSHARLPPDDQFRGGGAHARDTARSTGQLSGPHVHGHDVLRALRSWDVDAVAINEHTSAVGGDGATSPIGGRGASARSSDASSRFDGAYQELRAIEFGEARQAAAMAAAAAARYNVTGANKFVGMTDDARTYGPDLHAGAPPPQPPTRTSFSIDFGMLDTSVDDNNIVTVDVPDSAVVISITVAVFGWSHPSTHTPKILVKAGGLPRLSDPHTFAFDTHPAGRPLLLTAVLPEPGTWYISLWGGMAHQGFKSWPTPHSFTSVTARVRVCDSGFATGMICSALVQPVLPQLQVIEPEWAANRGDAFVSPNPSGSPPRTNVCFDPQQVTNIAAFRVESGVEVVNVTADLLRAANGTLDVWTYVSSGSPALTPSVPATVAVLNLTYPTSTMTFAAPRAGPWFVAMGVRQDDFNYTCSTWNQSCPCGSATAAAAGHVPGEVAISVTAAACASGVYGLDSGCVKLVTPLTRLGGGAGGFFADLYASSHHALTGVGTVAALPTNDTFGHLAEALMTETDSRGYCVIEVRAKDHVDALAAANVRVLLRRDGLPTLTDNGNMVADIVLTAGTSTHNSTDGLWMEWELAGLSPGRWLMVIHTDAVYVDTVSTFHVRLRPCSRRCAGWCDMGITGALLYPACNCRLAHLYTMAGEFCTERVVSEDHYMVMVLMLTLSNLFMVPAIVVAYRAKLFLYAIVFLWNMLASIAMHSCNLDYACFGLPKDSLKAMDIAASWSSIGMVTVFYGAHGEALQQVLPVLFVSSLAWVQWLPDGLKLAYYIVGVGGGSIMLFVGWGPVLWRAVKAGRLREADRATEYSCKRCGCGPPRTVYGRLLWRLPIQFLFKSGNFKVAVSLTGLAFFISAILCEVAFLTGDDYYYVHTMWHFFVMSAAGLLIHGRMHPHGKLRVQPPSAAGVPLLDVAARPSAVGAADHLCADEGDDGGVVTTSPVASRTLRAPLLASEDN